MSVGLFLQGHQDKIEVRLSPCLADMVGPVYIHIGYYLPASPQAFGHIHDQITDPKRNEEDLKDLGVEDLGRAVLQQRIYEER
jgi:hypothetical protein